MNIPNNHDTLFLQIFNNVLYSNRKDPEERHICIINQIKKVLELYKLPNIIFAYSTRDNCPHKNHEMYTHAKEDKNYKNMLAPCFTFDCYLENNVLIQYKDNYINLIKNSDMDNWNNRIDNIIFAGSLTNENYRIVNTNFINLKKPAIILNQDSNCGEKFISRIELCKYKFLLHLNGNGGAYSSRLKYLMLAGGLVFYITDYKNQNIYHEEYWMQDEDFKNCLIICKNLKECEEKVNYYLDNQEEAFKIAKKGFEYVKEKIKFENVLLDWKIILEKNKNVSNKLIYKNKL